MIELGPLQTGKTYLYRNISYYGQVLSGGKATQPSSSATIPGRSGWSGQGMRWFSIDRSYRFFGYQIICFNNARLYAGCEIQSEERKRFSAFLVLYLSGILMCREISPTKNIIISLSRSLISFRLLPLLTGFMATPRLGNPETHSPEIFERLRIYYGLPVRDDARTSEN